MNWAMAIPAGMQAATSLAGYFGRRRRPSLGSTAYGGMLKKRMQGGIYPPETRRKMLSLTGSTLGQAAQGERENIRGQLVNTGMGRSIAGVRAMGEPGRERMRSLADYTKQIDIQNELAKREAEERYRQMEFGYEDQRREEESQAKQSLFSGLSGAAALGYGEYQYQKELDKLEEFYQGLNDKYFKGTTGGIK